METIEQTNNNDLMLKSNIAAINDINMILKNPTGNVLSFNFETTLPPTFIEKLGLRAKKSKKPSKPKLSAFEIMVLDFFKDADEHTITLDNLLTLLYIQCSKVDTRNDLGLKMTNTDLSNRISAMKLKGLLFKTDQRGIYTSVPPKTVI